MKIHTQQDLKLAYQIVQADLFNSLLKAKDSSSIRLGNLGKFTKKEKKQRCGWDGQNYVYYRISFSMFGKLKKELNNYLKKKYNLK